VVSLVSSSGRTCVQPGLYESDAVATIGRIGRYSVTFDDPAPGARRPDELTSETAKEGDQIKGESTTKPSPLLGSSIAIRKATDEVEAAPGFFEGDTVAHCGPTLKGEFARTVNLTDMHIGWVFTRSVPNNAHIHILGALKAGIHGIPYEV